MQGQEVTITDMMFCRDRRVQIQNEFIEKYHHPVVSFCMNIPGPIKTTPLIQKGFEAGKEALLHALSVSDMTVLESRVFHDITGNEMLLCVDASAEKIKDLTQQIEETHPYGRLFDMDVIGINGQKLSRPTYRKCLICDCQAQECARSRKHTIEEMQDKIESILRDEEATL
nr:citrate lyase holo-[acyl-carrier protein] synthase [uncultured Blautia sp.]